ncbi:hypothetical protein Tco_1290671, partial [Tanacetum coccineum]
TGSSRDYDSIVSKWKKRVRSRIGTFCVIIDNVEANYESGTNDLDVYHKACEKYKMMYKSDFTLEHCYNVLNYHPGGKDVEMPYFCKTHGRKKSKTSETTSGSASGGLNFNEEADEDVEETQEFRPMSRDRAKAKKKAVGSSRGGSSSFVDVDTKDGNMEMEPDIENMTMSEYLEYEATKERRLWDDVRSRRSPTNYYEAGVDYFHRNKSKNFSYLYSHNLTPPHHCFLPVQPYPKNYLVSTNESNDVDIENITIA